ncbi:MAG: BrnT family toxin [Endomicrobiales bacterium]|jgi:uncharacterized DUF497 family protein
MSEITFAWDGQKARNNQKKHGISFEEAETVFHDPNAIVINDPDHSDDEDRFIILGVSFTQHILVVCHCYRSSDSVIRIISARKANKQEKEDYRRPL